jgi:tyrosyl-tRNA synthetase
MSTSPALAEAQARGLIKDATDLSGLEAAMQSRISVYAGFDPTAGSLHVGHLAPIMLLRLLARHGHRPIAIAGGVTAQIGDPSGRTEARALLSPSEIDRNLARITEQLETVLGQDTPVLDNSRWLGQALMPAFLREIAPHFSVSRMLSAESVSQRLDSGDGISALEFFYPLLQAADFLTLFRREGCVLQIGGSDQWSNILGGIELIRRVEGAKAFGLTQPLITTANGAKMGKTASGAVWLDAGMTDDQAFFQFWRNTDDGDVGRFLRLFTEIPLAEIAELETATGAGLNAVKERLAHEVTRLVRGAATADQALTSARALFAGQRSEAVDLQAIEVSPAELAAGISLAAVLHRAGLADSRGAARRLIQNGGVRIDGKKVNDPGAELLPAVAGQTVSVGKKRHARLLVRS